jgi:HAD superfamily hydrolase (TIGR01549 family)
LFFDLGGTLFSYGGRLGGGGVAHVVQAVGIDAPPREIGLAWGRASQETHARYAKMAYFLHRDLFRDTLSVFLRTFGHEAGDGLCDEFLERQRQSVLDELPIRQECHEALAALNAAGLYLCIVSNIDDDYLDPLVARHALNVPLDDWISSEQARSCKPDTGIFNYALEKSGLGPGEVLFVGDSLHHDVAGADAVGMRSARIVEEGVITPLTDGLEITAEPSYEIRALTELVGIVEQCNHG